MGFQGKLLNSSDDAVTDGNITINISTADNCEGGVYSKKFIDPFSNDGIFDLMLGNDTALPLNYNQNYYLCVLAETNDTAEEQIGGNFIFQGGQGEIGTEDTDFTDQALFTTSGVNFATVQANTVGGNFSTFVFGRFNDLQVDQLLHGEMDINVINGGGADGTINATGNITSGSHICDVTGCLSNKIEGNLFDQILNQSSYVEFAGTNITDNLCFDSGETTDCITAWPKDTNISDTNLSNGGVMYGNLSMNGNNISDIDTLNVDGNAYFDNYLYDQDSGGATFIQFPGDNSVQVYSGGYPVAEFVGGTPSGYMWLGDGLEEVDFGVFGTTNQYLIYANSTGDYVLMEEKLNVSKNITSDAHICDSVGCIGEGGADTNFSQGGVSNDTILINASQPYAIRTDTNGIKVSSAAQGVFDVIGNYTTTSITTPLYFHPNVEGTGTGANFLGVYIAPKYSGAITTYGNSYRPSWETGTTRKDILFEYKPSTQDMTSNTSHTIYTESQIPSSLVSSSPAVNNTFIKYRGFTMGQSFGTVTFMPGVWNMDITSVLLQLKGGGAINNYAGSGGSVISRGINFTGWGDITGTADIQAIEVHGGGIFNFSDADEFYTGNFSGTQYYAETSYYNHSGFVMTFGTQSVYYNASFSDSILNGFELNDNYKLTTKIAGLYKFGYSASGEGQNNHIYELKLYINGIEQNKTSSYVTMEGATARANMNGQGFLQLNINDNVTLRMADESGNGDGKIYSLNIEGVRIGD